MSENSQILQHTQTDLKDADTVDQLYSLLDKLIDYICASSTSCTIIENTLDYLEEFVGMTSKEAVYE